MREARARLDWDQTASVLAQVATALSGSYYSPLEFHPYRRDEMPGVEATKPRNAR